MGATLLCSTADINDNEFDAIASYDYDNYSCTFKSYTDGGFKNENYGAFRRIKDEESAYTYFKYFKESKKNMHDNIKKYFDDISKKFNRITMDKHIMDNMPTIKGTRIPVTLILACLRDEIAIDEICESYELTPQQIEESVDFVIQVLKDPYLEDEE